MWKENPLASPQAKTRSKPESSIIERPRGSLTHIKVIPPLTARFPASGAVCGGGGSRDAEGTARPGERISADARLLFVRIAQQIFDERGDQEDDDDPDGDLHFLRGVCGAEATLSPWAWVRRWPCASGRTHPWARAPGTR